MAPVVRHITRTVGLSSEDRREARREKLQAFLGRLATPETLALMTGLLIDFHSFGKLLKCPSFAAKLSLA
jgi:hypothetical protein